MGARFTARIEDVTDCGSSYYNSLIAGYDLLETEKILIEDKENNYKQSNFDTYLAHESNTEDTSSNSKQFDFNIFPNPNDGYFTLTLDAEDIKNYSVEIANTFGMPIFKADYQNTNEVTINRRDLSPGIYYVRVTMENNVLVKKFVINWLIENVKM